MVEGAREDQDLAHLVVDLFEVAVRNMMGRRRNELEELAKRLRRSAKTEEANGSVSNSLLTLPSGHVRELHAMLVLGDAGFSIRALRLGVVVVIDLIKPRLRV